MTASLEAPERLRIADPLVRFGDRAARLRALAEGHSAGDWLRLLARVADGQRAAAREIAVEPIAASAEGPPLAFERVRRDPAWRSMLRRVIAEARTDGLPAAASAALAELAAADEARLERLAQLHLAGTTDPDSRAAAPFVAAALQAWFAGLASRLPAVSAGAVTGACPVCGAPPVAGVIEGETRVRWLSCSLCGSDWSFPRVTCVSCGEEEGLATFRVDGDDGALAEACDACRGYVKLFDLARRPGAEPSADDAATLALDLLMGEAGYERVGPGPMLGGRAALHA